MSICFDEIDQCLRVLYRRRWKYAVSEIENMPARAGALQYVFRSRFQFCRVPEKGAGIQIALNGHTVSDPGHGFGNRYPPVDAENVRPEIRHRLENVGATIDIQNAGHAIADL